MSKITKELSNIHSMLLNMHRDLGLTDLNPTEKFIFLKIINEIEANKINIQKIDTQTSKLNRPLD